MLSPLIVFVHLFLPWESQVVAQLSLGSYFANARKAFSYLLIGSLCIKNEKQKAQGPELADWSKKQCQVINL